MTSKERLEELERKCGYHFKEPALLQHAMCHSSYANEKHMKRLQCNERLEFLGDAVLEMVSSDYLYHHFPMEEEGNLTKLRASLVCEPTLAFDAGALDLGNCLLLGKGEEATGGRKRDSVVSDALEALIGAIYLDGGIEPARTFIETFVLNDISGKRLFYDSKTVLQEMIQGSGAGVLSYRLAGESGPDHDKVFISEVLVGDRILGSGSGKSKKAAEQQAAYHAICVLRENQ